MGSSNQNRDACGRDGYLLRYKQVHCVVLTTNGPNAVHPDVFLNCLSILLFILLRQGLSGDRMLDVSARVAGEQVCRIHQFWDYAQMIIQTQVLKPAQQAL